MEKQKDLEAIDYDVNDIVEDKRFLRCKKEMRIIMVVGLIQIIIPAILIYTLNGNGKWFLGYPMWYGVALAFYLCMSLAAVIVTIKLIKPHKLDAIADDKEEAK